MSVISCTGIWVRPGASCLGEARGAAGYAQPMPDSLTPFSFRCGLTTPNRLALAPLTNCQSEADGTLGEAERAYLVRRAQGGLGVVSTCASHVQAQAQGFPGQLACYGEQHVEGLRRLAGELRAAGALPIVQLYHGGARCPSALTGVQPTSASAFVEERPGFEQPRALEHREIAGIVKAFVDAGVRVVRAGFAGVEVHGAHGYLLGQFLSTSMNQRDDEWGGSLENRARLIREIVRGLRANLPDDAMIWVRLSLEDGGFSQGHRLDESVQVARWLADDGADAIHASLWDIHRMSLQQPNLHPLQVLRGALPPEVAVVAAGNVWTSADVDYARLMGADLVAVGRAAILDPDWMQRVLVQHEAPLRGPLSAAELAAVAISPGFVQYLRRFKGLVAED